MDKKLKRQLYDLVADDQVDDAIELLQDKLSIDHPSYLRLIKLARRYRELDDQSMDAIIAHEDAKLAKNQIADTLLHIVQTVDRPPLEEPTPPPRQEPKVVARQQPPPSPPSETSVPASSPVKEGFVGPVKYAGSPSMKERTISIPYGYNEAWNRCIDAITTADMSLDAEERAKGTIQASTSGNFITSFGERILIYVTSIDDGQTRVHLIVDSVLKTMIVDWGRNNNKLNLLISYLM